MTPHLICLDLDGMVADLHTALVNLYNAAFDCALSAVDAFTATHVDGRPVVDVYDRYLHRNRVFRDLAPLPGALAAVDQLRSMGQVIIVSAPSRNPDSASDKIVWCRDVLGIDRKDIVLTTRKYLVNSQIWLDDWPEHIRLIRSRNPNAFIGAIAYPYNASVEPALSARADGFLDTKTAWASLISDVERHLRCQA